MKALHCGTPRSSWCSSRGSSSIGLQPRLVSCRSSSNSSSRLTLLSSVGSRRQRSSGRLIRTYASSSTSDGSGSTAAAAAAAVEDEQVAPFSEQELHDMAAADGSEEQQELGDVWRSVFQEDLNGLYDYVDREQMELSERIAGLKGVPQHLWEKVGLMDNLEKFPPGLVADIMGLGSWRLKGNVDEVFVFLLSRLEGAVRELLDTDLALYPPGKWKEKGWDFIDSADPARELAGFSYVDMPDPLKGMEGYPRLLIENRIYSSRVFRKLHLELAVRQDGLQVLHMVFFPRYDFDIPILALDLVAAGGAVSLAIIDTCPLSPRLTLPAHYANTVAELQQHFLPESVRSRSIPDWGKAIFSPLCVCIRPQEPQELAGFMKYAVALTRAHLMYSSLLQPLDPMHKPSVRRLSELLACHQRFCEQQLANTKTSRVLEASFDKEFTDAYMQQLMFDYSPREDVPWFDGSLARLYEYFETNPEVWADAGEFLKTKMKLDDAKASEYLNRFLSGDDSIKLPRLAFALQHMYDHDSDFQGAVDRSLVDLEPDALPIPSAMGDHLAKQLMQMVYGGRAKDEQPLAAASGPGAQQEQQGGAAQEAPGAVSGDAGKTTGSEGPTQKE